MALVVDTWNEMTFLPFSNAAWTGLANPPTIPSTLAKAILAGTSVIAWVQVAGANPVISFLGGTATFPVGVIDTESLQTGVEVTDTFGSVTEILQIAGAETLWYNVSSSFVIKYDAAATADIHTVTT